MSAIKLIINLSSAEFNINIFCSLYGSYVFISVYYHMKLHSLLDCTLLFHLYFIWLIEDNKGKNYTFVQGEFNCKYIIVTHSYFLCDILLLRHLIRKFTFFFDLLK